LNFATRNYDYLREAIIMASFLSDNNGFIYDFQHFLDCSLQLKKIKFYEAIIRISSNASFSKKNAGLISLISRSTFCLIS
jgi:hypothetical protein